tara:strand:+ start:237 stop:449 length:213 start_codon:yes stop_codon:yes gene_type:complete
MHPNPDVVIVDTGYKMVDSLNFIGKFDVGVTKKLRGSYFFEGGSVDYAQARLSIYGFLDLWVIVGLRAHR